MAGEKTPLKWKFETGGEVRSIPEVSDGVVYFCSDDHHLYALDVKTGKEKWKFETGAGVCSSPAVSDGAVYFGSYDHYLYAVDIKTGKEKWKFKTGDAVYSSPAVVDGVVYVGSGDHHLYAVDSKAGEEKWKFKTGDWVSSSPAVSDGVVYFGSNDNHLYAVDIKTGKEKWKYKTGDNVGSDPVILNDKVYFGSYDHYLYAVDKKTGKEKWKYKATSTDPVILNDMVYFGSNDWNLYAVDIKTGEVKWKFKTGSYVFSSPIVLDGVVYFGSFDHHLYALDVKTGKEKWKFQTGGNFKSSPAVSDGVVYFGSSDNHLYAVDIKIAEKLAPEMAKKWDKEEQQRPKEAEQKEKELEQLTQIEVRDKLKTESIGSEFITAISKRTDLDDINREIVDLKIQLGKLIQENESSDNARLLQDAFLSVTDWGKDIFDALYKDKNPDVRNALAMNPSLPESLLPSLFEDEENRVKLSVLSNPSCPVNILIEGSKDTENYASSRIRGSIALNVKTPKDIITQFLKDEYRWVREAAASNELVKKNKINELVKNGDRYILKGLLENPNPSEGIKTEITEMLKDENKYPIETDTYVIEISDTYESVGGTMDIDYLVDLIADEGSREVLPGLPGEWHEWNNLYHDVGDYELKDSIQMPDGSYENLNLKLKTNISDCAADFIITMSSGLDDYGENYEIELEDVFDPDKLNIEEEYGRVYGYIYDGETFYAGTSTIEGASWDGWEHAYAWESLIIQIKTDSGYKEFDVEDEISTMEDEGIELSDVEAVRKYFKETYNL